MVVYIEYIVEVVMNMCVFNWVVCMVFIAIRIALIYVRRMFWSPCHLSNILGVVVGAIHCGPCNVAFYLSF